MVNNTAFSSVKSHTDTKKIKAMMKGAMTSRDISQMIGTTPGHFNKLVARSKFPKEDLRIYNELSHTVKRYWYKSTVDKALKDSEYKKKEKEAKEKVPRVRKIKEPKDTISELTN